MNSRCVVPYARNLLLSSSLLPIFVAYGPSPMHSRSDPVQRLLSWCSSKRIHIDERLSIIQDEIRGEISVFNLSEGMIPVSQTLVTIPRRWMLSIRTCTSSDSLVTWLADNGIHVPVYGHEAQLTLALALYSEFFARVALRVGRLSAISTPEGGTNRALLGVQIFGRRRSRKGCD